MNHRPHLCKIYSRKRLNLFKRKYRSPNKFLICLFVLLMLILIVYTSYKAIDPIFQKLCVDRAKSIATLITNTESTKVMSNHTYDELFNVDKDSDGKIQLLSANIIKINEITSDIAINIQNKLNEVEEEEVKLSVGSITGMNLLSGTGPKVKIKISSAGNVDTDLKSEFLKQNINYTLHRVYLQIDCHINVLTPYSIINENISNQVLLVENMIVGEIPDTFYNLEGLDGESSALEVIE